MRLLLYINEIWIGFKFPPFLFLVPEVHPNRKIFIPAAAQEILLLSLVILLLKEVRSSSYVATAIFTWLTRLEMAWFHCAIIQSCFL